MFEEKQKLKFGQSSEEARETSENRETYTLTTTTPEGTQTSKISIESSHLSDLGDVFVRNKADMDGFVTNRGDESQHQGKGRSFYEGNSASGKGGVMNGKAGKEEIEAYFRGRESSEHDPKRLGMARRDTGVQSIGFDT